MSLVAVGQELKGFVKAFKQKPKIICVQETWLKPNLSFRITSHVCLHKDRNTSVGGCAVFKRRNSV